MQVSLTRRSDKLAILEVYDDEAHDHTLKLVYERRISRFNQSDANFLVKNCGISPSNIHTILRSLYDAEENSDDSVFVLPEESIPVHFWTLIGITPPTIELEDDQESIIPTTGSPFTVRVRSMQSPKQFAESYTDPLPGEALKQAFNYTNDGVEPVIEWEDVRTICCLDVDYHTLPLEERPTVQQFDTAVSYLTSKPFCWHPSHASGIKLYYTCSPGYHADELAAIAMLEWTQFDSIATFDFCKQSRHPSFERIHDKRPAPCRKDEIQYTYGKASVGAIRRMLSQELEFSDVQTILLEKGWTIGQHLPHSQCPINASTDDKLNVYVGDQGIYCHRCAARGLGPNSKRPGFMHYGHFRNDDYHTLFGSMVRNFCHSDHAVCILQTQYPTIPVHILEKIYRVMLKIVHPHDDPRIGMCFTSGQGYVRCNGAWMSKDGSSIITENTAGFIRSFPAVLLPAEKGFTLNVSKYTALVNRGDITEYGYPDISFLRGCKVYGHHLPYKKGEFVRSVIHKSLRSNPPQYLSKTNRMPEREYTQIFQEEFPGLEISYLKLLVAAKGVSEGRLSQCPYLLVNGPSGSGKSTVPHLAAGICGDKAEEPIFVPDPSRFRQSLMDSSRESSYIVVNEIFKLADMHRLSPVQALNPMLSLTEDSRSHVLYVGSLPFGRLPVFVLTDINTPMEVESDIQIARRFVRYTLQRRTHWEDTFTKRGIKAHEFRLISPLHSHACDSILSDVIDTFFQEPTSLQTIAESLNAGPLETDSPTMEAKDDLLKRFYNLVIKARPVSGSDADRYRPHQGWKKIMKGDSSSELTQTWSQLCDSSDRFTESRIVASVNWPDIIGVNFPDFPEIGVRCDFTGFQRSTVYVRFASTENRRYPAWINGIQTRPFYSTYVKGDK